MLTGRDSAGQKAALSYVSIFLKAGLDARFAELPEGTDPDQILIQKGTDALHQIIEGAHPMVEYVIRQKVPVLAQKLLLNRKNPFANGYFAAMLEIDSRIVLEGYLEQLSRLLNIPIDALKTDFSSYRKNRSPAYRKPTNSKRTFPQNP